MGKIIVIVGPTSSGKTALAVRIAKAVGGEVVSADSRQVYRGLNLGSGKTSVREMRGIPHLLIDVASPRRPFTADRYARLARRAIKNIETRGNVPVIAGGTGLYIDAVLGRVTLSSVKPNHALRAQLACLPLAALARELKRLDPVRYKTIDQKNPQRLIRAIEIALDGGRSAALPAAPEGDVLWIGIDYPRAALAKRIRARLLKRLKNGMLAEAKRLHRKGLTFKRMGELGLEYRLMARHLAGKISYEEMMERLESEICKYARRQMTWFRKNPDINWVAPNELGHAVRAAKRFARAKTAD